MSFNEDTTGSDGVGPTVVITATNGTLGSPGAVVNSVSTITAHVWCYDPISKLCKKAYLLDPT
mgnify:CR=1 FL=1